MVLRDYQSETVTAIEREWEQVVSTLACIPTGGGKTCVAAEVIKRKQPGRAMFICHRAELAWQARNAIQKHTGLECGVEMGELHVQNSLFGDAPVIVATVQSLNSKWHGRTRMSKFKPEDFNVLICDEFHHFTAPIFKNVMNYFRQNPKLRILGITATPDRADEEALGQVCDTVATDIEIIDLIHRGWLVPIDQQFVQIAGLDFSHMRTTCGDLNGADLASVMESESNLQGIAGASIEIIGNRRAIVFTASVKQAETISNIFNRHKPGMSDWVCGKTETEARKTMLDKFKSGGVQVIANCGVLTEGFDDAGVEVIIMARPTKSRSLYSQMAGRSTRPLPGLVDGLATPEERRAAIAGSGKPSCLIVDFVGNSGKHKLMSSADILGGKVSDDAVARALAIAKKKGGAVRMSEVLDEAEEDIRKEAEERRLAEEARKAKVLAKVRYAARSVNPFDVFEITPVRERGWDNGRVLSDKQKSVLLRAGINPDKMKYSEAKTVLDEMFRRMGSHLASYKQCKLLRAHGYETREMTMNDATRLISELANNGWKKKPVLNPVIADNVPF